jgi:hypothetical protein
MKKWFNKRGIINLVEMEWWQECSIPGQPEYSVVATPAMVTHILRRLLMIALVGTTSIPDKHDIME